MKINTSFTSKEYIKKHVLVDCDILCEYLQREVGTISHEALLRINLDDYKEAMSRGAANVIVKFFSGKKSENFRACDISLNSLFNFFFHHNSLDQ